MDGDRPEAVAGDAVTLTLADEVDISRGDVLCDAQARPEVSDQFAAHLLWMAEEELLPGRQYLLKLATATVPATVSALKHKVDVNTLEHLAAKTLALNEVGYCNFPLSQPLAFDPYRDNRDMGGFILIDRFTNATVGAGMIDFGLRRATNVHWQALDVNKAARAAMKGQKPAVLWFTGLSGSGKSTIANLVEKALAAEGRAHLSAGRRQCPPRPQSRSGLHRCRPGGEYSPRGRDRQAVPGCGPDRAGVLHLALPLRAAHGARACGARASSSRYSSIRRWRSACSAIPRAFTKRRGPG